MGFFDGFMKGFNGGSSRSRQQNNRPQNRRISSSNREILDMVHDEYGLEDDYRRTAFYNAQSNNGWYTCARCGRKFRRGEMDVDHIIPKSRGGDNSRYNLQLLCKHCNRSKGNDISYSNQDLKRRRRELRNQDQRDSDFLDSLKKKRR